MKTHKILYWSSTSLMILMVGVFSLADILQPESVKEMTLHLGLPIYLLPLFGTLKILGTTFAVVPALQRWREAAYAGIFYFFVGAMYCHMANGDEWTKLILPFTVLVISIVSYCYSNKRVA